MYIIGSNRYLNKQTPFEEGTTRKQIGKRTQARAQLVDANRPRQLFCLFILIFSLFFVRLFASPFACVLFTRPQEVHHSFFELYSTSSTSFFASLCAFLRFLLAPTTIPHPEKRTGRILPLRSASRRSAQSFFSSSNINFVLLLSLSPAAGVGPIFHSVKHDFSRTITQEQTGI